MYKYVLFIGPIPPPFTGQSFVFETAFNNFPYRKKVINTNRYNNKILNTFYTIFLLLIYCTIEKPKLIYMTCSRTFNGSIKDVVILFISSLLDIKVINHLHGADLNLFIKSSNKTYAKLLKYLYKSINKTIILSKSMIDQLSEFPNMKYTVIPNFYSKELDVNYMQKDGSKIRILFLSNVMKSKGIFEFLETCELLFQDNSIVNDIRVDICGLFLEDKYMSKKEIEHFFYLKYNTLKKNYNKNIYFNGYTSGKEKIEFLYESDIFVLPSYTEAYPISIIEAMRTGNVIIASAVDYLPQIVSNKSGKCVDLDPQKFYEDIREYIINVDLRKKTQKYNIDFAKNNFSQTLFTNRLNCLLNKD